MGLFDISGKPGIAPSPNWAKKISRVIANAFDTSEPGVGIPKVKGNETLTPGVGDSGVGSMSPASWKVQQDRKNVYRDIERMDAEDELVSTALDIVAECAVGYADLDQRQNDPKPLISSKNAKVAQILNDMSDRIGLDFDLYQIAREMYPHGTIFREVIIDRALGQVKMFKQTVPYMIYPKMTDNGDKQPGWIIKTDKDMYNDTGAELEEWQIVPFFYGAKRGFLTVPPLASARSGWKRLNAMEDGMAVARLVRAYDKYVHRVPVEKSWTPQEITATIKKYKDFITKRKLMQSDGQMAQNDTPLDVQSDFFLADDGSNRGGVDVLSSNNIQLGNLNDVYFHREKLLARLKVPVAYLQIQSSMKSHLRAGGNMDSVDIQYARTLRSVQASLRRGIGRLCDIELLLHGIVPTKGLYYLNLPEINTKDLAEEARIELTYAQAAAFFIESFGALPPALIANKFLKLNDEQQKLMDKFLTADADRIMEARIKAIENTAIPPPGMPGGPPQKALPGGAGGVGSGGSGKKKQSLTEKFADAKALLDNPGDHQQSGTAPVESLVELFYTLNEGVIESLQAAGIPAGEIGETHRQLIRQSLLDMAYTEGNVALPGVD